MRLLNICPKPKIQHNFTTRPIDMPLVYSTTPEVNLTYLKDKALIFIRNAKLDFTQRKWEFIIPVSDCLSIFRS